MLGSGGEAAGITAARAALWAAVIPTMSGGSAFVVPLLVVDEALVELEVLEVLEVLLALVVLLWPDDAAVLVAALDVIVDPLLAELEPVGALDVVPDDPVAPP
jgi:hypothetical protein